MSGRLHGNRVLIVDDERIIADTLALILAQRGIETRVAYSAEDALELLSQWEPELAILDVCLPKMNGIDLAVAIKAIYPRCGFLILSGNPATFLVAEKAAEMGHPFEVWAKPTHPNEILAEVGALLSQGRGVIGSDGLSMLTD